MSPRRRNGHGTPEALDDATVEELLAGRYPGDAPDLVALSELLGQVRSFGERPAPLRSESLVAFLGDSAPASEGRLPAWSRRLFRGLNVGPSGRGAQPPEPAALGRSRRIHLPIAAATAFAVVAALVVAAGSARLLPGPAQNVVAKFVQAVTPFDFPEQRQPKAVRPEAPSPETYSPSQERPGPVPADSSQAHTGELEARGSPSVGPGRAGNRSQPSGVDALPTPATMAPEPNGRSSPGGTPSLAPPPPEPNRFSAHLVGAMGSETAGDADGQGTAALDVRVGSAELCLTLFVANIAPVTAVHLHAQAAGVSHRVLAAWTESSGGASAECVAVDRQLIKKLRKEPGKFSVDVHTTEFPNGAVRGALTT